MGSQRRRWGVASILPLTVLMAAVVPLLIGPSAGAAPALHRSTTCPTEAYTGSTVADCDTTTTTTSGSVHLRSAEGPSFSNGRLTWEICGYPASAIGDTIRLYISGQTEPTWTSTVGSDGCVSFSVPWCPSTGTYTVAAVDQTHSDIPEATGQVKVSAGAACAATVGHHGNLAFTGSNILKMLLAAIAVIVVGYIVVRSNRQRRRAQ